MNCKKPSAFSFASHLIPLLALGLGGCGMLGTESPALNTPTATDNNSATTPTPVNRPDLLTAAELSQTVRPLTSPVTLSAGRSEWVSVVLRVRTPGVGRAATLRLPGWTAGTQRLKGRSRVYQVLSMPLDVNRAAYVRQTGQAVAAETLPRALLPVTVQDGRIDLTKLRDPKKPTDPNGTAVDTDVLLWIDQRVAIDATPGHYDTTFAWQTDATGQGAAATPAETRATVTVGLDVADFVVPDDRHLNMVADLPWERLRRLWPEHFEAVRPQLLSRRDKDAAGAVATLDGLVALAQEHRVQVHIPRLQPVVKWKPGQPVVIDWEDYDALVGPWLSGQAFTDRVPLGFWALPRIDYLSNRPAASQVEYYASAAAHFDQRDWLRLSPVILTKESPGRANVTERVLLSAEASRVLRAHPRVRVMLPLEPAEAQLASDRSPDLIDPTASGRLNCVAPGLISDSALLTWPKELERPQNWLRTDLSGLIPYTGAGGDESDVRVWSWVAFLRRANLIQWDACLPVERTPEMPADPNELVWFYPGSWFGVDQPVPTVQLKWLRRAQQDFEYLRLADQRGSLLSVLPMARLLAKPVEIQPGQSPDPVYGLLIGTANTNAWAALKPLLTRILQSRGPGITPDETAMREIDQQTLRWMEPLEKPVILPRRTEWQVATPPPGEVGPWVNLLLSFDLYNASDTTPERNQLSFTRLSPGWIVQPQPTEIPKLSMFQVVPQVLLARLDPGRVNSAVHPPVRIEYRSGQTGATTPLDIVAPVARSTRRTAPLLINGSLDDWVSDDALQGGPLVKFMSRPAVQSHALEYASTKTEAFSAWGDDDFYLAFRADGLGGAGRVIAGRNFVDYQQGRA
ncbi:MAG TPA: hypothetical protein VF595_16925, partial [Tepidisphaeraceae bacterium]